jgi:hypothetical protein
VLDAGQIGGPGGTIRRLLGSFVWRGRAPLPDQPEMAHRLSMVTGLFSNEGRIVSSKMSTNDSFKPLTHRASDPSQGSPSSARQAVQPTVAAMLAHRRAPDNLAFVSVRSSTDRMMGGVGLLSAVELSLATSLMADMTTLVAV